MVNPAHTEVDPASPDFDVVVVGAGIAGLCMLQRLRALGFKARLFETAPSVGGTWYWNCYPGARCDVPSLDYSYSFSDELQQEWRWSERYATQPEILAYLNHVADRFDLRSDIQLETSVTAMTYQPAAATWRVETDRGDVVSARFCVMATGCLTVVQFPPVPGLDTFQGRAFHSARWPREGVDFTDRRVGVIGTGSSGIQIIPLVGQQASHLTVFQRTPGFCFPARNSPLDDESDAAMKARYAAYRLQARQTPAGIVRPTPDKGALEASAEERRAVYQSNWEAGGSAIVGAFKDILLNRESNDTVVAFVHEKIREIVKDPATAEALLPRTYPVGAKRVCVGTDYYETFNQPNVDLVDLGDDPIVEILPTGVRTASRTIDLDDLVFATGFDAMTGALTRIDVRGTEGQMLRDAWAGGPRTYLGLTVAGFPNMFIVAGPGSPSVISNMFVAIEQHVDWIGQCLDTLRRRGVASIEAKVDRQDEWVDHVNEVASHTLYPLGASWYLGANTPGKQRVFMPYVGGLHNYAARCDEVAREGYRDFILAPSTVPVEVSA